MAATRRPAVEPAKVKALKAATRRIHELNARIGVAFYELGLELKRVRDGKLYDASAHRGFKAYLAREAKVHPATAFKLIRIVELFTREQAHELGLEKLDAAVKLMNATPEDEDPKAVSSLRVKTGKPGAPRSKKLSEASPREVRAAASAARAKANGSGADTTDRRVVPAEGIRLASTIEKDLRGAGLDGVEVRARKTGPKPANGGSSGAAPRYVIDLIGLAPDRARKAALALKR